MHETLLCVGKYKTDYWEQPYMSSLYKLSTSIKVASVGAVTAVRHLQQLNN